MQLPKCCEWSKDNLRFDSVWRNGQRVWGDELAAARSGAYVLWREEKTSYRSYSCSVPLCFPSFPSLPCEHSRSAYCAYMRHVQHVIYRIKAQGRAGKHRKWCARWKGKLQMTGKKGVFARHSARIRPLVPLTTTESTLAVIKRTTRTRRRRRRRRKNNTSTRIK